MGCGASLRPLRKAQATHGRWIIAPTVLQGNHSKGLGLQKPTDFHRRAYPRLLLEEKLSPQVTDEVYLTPPRKATSSVTAYAVPPSPQGEGFGVVEICWIYSITSMCAVQHQFRQHTLPGLKLFYEHPQGGAVFWCRCPVAVPEILCSHSARRISTAATRSPPLSPPPAAGGSLPGLSPPVLVSHRDNQKRTPRWGVLFWCR